MIRMKKVNFHKLLQDGTKILKAIGKFIKEAGKLAGTVYFWFSKVADNWPF